MSCKRSDIVKQMQAWVGLNESDGSHKKIIDIYNTITPIPVGYKLEYTDPWCAGTVSAAAQSCGATDIIPTECGCSRMIDKAKSMGIWVENDDYIPQPADIPVYDWDDSGNGDNTGNPDHVGVVEKISGSVITVIEGNYSNAVKRRNIEINGKYIRGYITPKYINEVEKEMIKKIYIDPGHSHVDPGAVGFAVERDLNEKVAKFMNDHLLANYICETRIDPITNNSLSAISNSANAWKADLLVSIHFNAGGGDGFEALIYSNATLALGKVFEKHVKAIGQNSRGVKLNPGLAVLRQSNMPAILNEGAFVDNKKDIQDWDEDHELKKLGVAYAEAAAEWLKLDKKSTSKNPTVSTPVLTTPNAVITKPQGAGEIATGSTLSLKNVDLYSSSITTTKSRMATGVYYVWSKTAINGRIRITNSVSNVGKTGQVTGWIKKNDAQNALQDGSAPHSLSSTPYRVRVTTNKLNIRKGPGTTFATNGVICDKGIYTIIEEADGDGATKWLKLKSGAGWIASNYVTKV